MATGPTKFQKQKKASAQGFAHGAEKPVGTPLSFFELDHPAFGVTNSTALAGFTKTYANCVPAVVMWCAAWGSSDFSPSGVTHLLQKSDGVSGNSSP